MTNRFVASLLLVGALTCSLASVGCSGHSAGVPGPPPPGGFYVGIADQTSTGAPIGWHLSGRLTGNWVQDICNPPSLCQGSIKSFDVSAAWPSYISGGRAPAFWSGREWTFDFCLDPFVFPNGFVWSGNITAINQTFVPLTCFPPFASNGFFVQGSVPTTWAIQASGLTSEQGMPRLSLFSVSRGLISQTLATSVAPDGSSAVFPFPKNTNGTPLSADEYGYVIANQTSPNVFSEAAGNFFSIGTSDTSNISPYGVDAARTTVSKDSCTDIGACHSLGTTTSISPVVTLYSSNALKNGTALVAVGSQPVAVKLYKYASKSVTTGTRIQVTTTTTQPTRAVVANFGSGTVSVVDVVNSLVTNTISVGAQPVALLVKPDSTKCYVANFGSATVSEIDLVTMTQSRVASIGPNPTSLAMDSSGTAIWVAGQGYISRIDLGTFSATATLPAGGQVTSLAVSGGQNAFVYTALANNNTAFKVQQANMSNGAVVRTAYQSSLAVGSAYGQNGGPTSPPAWLLSTGPLVSAQYGNRYVATATPTGFVVIDLQTGIQMLQGATPSTVRGIAADPQEGTVYITAPESNSLLTVPLPPQA